MRATPRDADSCAGAVALSVQKVRDVRRRHPARSLFTLRVTGRSDHRKLRNPGRIRGDIVHARAPAGPGARCLATISAAERISICNLVFSVAFVDGTLTGV